MLHLHRSERADALVGALADVLAEPPDDAFAPDVVAVPTRGVERWLAQRLSHHLGAATCLRRGRCVRQRRVRLAGAAGGQGARGRRRPRPGRRPVAPVRPHLAAAAGRRRLRRRAVVRGARSAPRRRARRRAAAGASARASCGTWRGCSAPTAAQRPAMVRAWADGRDDDGTGAAGALRPRLAARAVARAARAARRAEPGRAAAGGACSGWSTSRTVLDLPARLSVFGATRLPADQLAVLARAERAPRGAPVARAPLTGALARGGRAGAGVPAPARPRLAGPSPAARLDGPRRHRAAAAARGARAGVRHPPPGAASPRPPCWVRCSAGCATTTPRRRPRRWPRTTAACRCTPATGGPGRSRCCARCSSGCSPTTRRSSRATWW